MATNARSTVVSLFARRDQAETAINHLRQAGFTDDRVGCIARHAQGGEAPASGGPAPAANRGPTPATSESGAGIGMLTGAAILGLTVGSLPGLLAGGLAGGLLGALIQLGLSEPEARLYHEEVAAGRTMVVARADERAHEVTDLLRRHGAHQVHSAAA